MDVRVLVFKETDFPFIDGIPVDIDELIEALPPVESVRIAGVDELRKRLKRESVDLLINPYGSAFPKDAWPEIYEFLAAGGSLVNLGGVPFSVPVRRKKFIWEPEIAQSGYLRDLLINQASPVDTQDALRYEILPTEPLLSGLEGDFQFDKAFELQVRFSSVDDLPDEVGTTGSREAIIHPLLYALDARKKKVAAPVIAIDRVFGKFAGGRWVLVNCTSENKLGKDILQRLLTFACMGPTDFQVRPSFACYTPDERVTFTLHVNRFEKPSKEPGRLSLFLKIRRGNITVTSTNVEIENFQPPYYRMVPLEIPLTPGDYIVDAVLSPSDSGLSEKYASHYTTGFWCYDSAMISMTQPLSAGDDFFMREDRASPLVGTTYMGADTHRRSFFEPNPAIWEKDFSEMQDMGLNVVRTGIWTDYRSIMRNPGSPDEGVLRALSAFLLSAAKHDITVIFTLFSFTPYGWEGVNPYLDPRSLQAQREYVSAFARRFAKFNNVMWDLINEPSLPSSGKRWTCRPNCDEFEKQAWQKWLRENHDADELDEQWRTTPRDSRGLPSARDFKDRETYEDTSPMRVLDYRLFAQDLFNRWVREITAVIRQNGNPKQLITVGQDEGGTKDRPNPQFHYKLVDFTGTHSWWNNDDLLWDGLVSKVPGKVSLIEETGIMPTQNPDKFDRRTEEDYRNLLERKAVMGFAAGCAGVIQWLWNTNVYMTTDCEVGIGAHRADLTRKPELEVLPAMAMFMREARPHFTNRELEDVCMVIPYSNILSARDNATEATRTAVRVMHYYCGLPMRAVGEYSLDKMGSPRLIILPSPHVLTQEAWETLLKAVDEGSTLLVTGPIDRDEYWRPASRMSEFGIDGEIRPVAREEAAIVLGTECLLTFGGNKVNRLDKVVVGGQSGFVKTETHGLGKVIYTPLPFELADNVEPIAALYQFAVRQAGLEAPFSVEKPDSGILIRPQFFSKTILYSVVSEKSTDAEVALTDKDSGRTLEVKVPAQRAVMFLITRSDGRVLAEYGGGVSKEEGAPA